MVGSEYRDDGIWVGPFDHGAGKRERGKRVPSLGLPEVPRVFEAVQKVGRLGAPGFGGAHPPARSLDHSVQPAPGMLEKRPAVGHGEELLRSAFAAQRPEPAARPSRDDQRMVHIRDPTFFGNSLGSCVSSGPAIVSHRPAVWQRRCPAKRPGVRALTVPHQRDTRPHQPWAIQCGRWQLSFPATSARGHPLRVGAPGARPRQGVLRGAARPHGHGAGGARGEPGRHARERGPGHGHGGRQPEGAGRRRAAGEGARGGRRRRARPARRR